jgi:hypothetical protein|tara:strand:- start:99 stop:389 length:291 start_codon:yes stop_codon:yes gene_type:complete
LARLYDDSQVAAKFLDDSYYPNLFYSQLGGIPLKELNNLEVLIIFSLASHSLPQVEFLFGLNFALHVSPHEYCRYYSGLSPLGSAPYADSRRQFRD